MNNSYHSIIQFNFYMALQTPWNKAFCGDRQAITCFYSLITQHKANSKVGMITNEEVIEELMKMAQDIANAHKAGNEMGLSDEELAFYDALTKPEAVKDFYTNEQLIAITRDLTEQLKKSRTVDWKKKESARAGMRRMVKRLLKKYDYPPEGMEDAIKTVISQCEMWTDNDEFK